MNLRKGCFKENLPKLWFYFSIARPFMNIIGGNTPMTKLSVESAQRLLWISYSLQKKILMLQILLKLGASDASANESPYHI